MIDTPQPGKALDCRAQPKNEFLDPRCNQLVQFLEGNDSYWEYKYFYCPHCTRIWESSFFYQDWEPFWEILEWEKFKEKKERWVDSSGTDHYPHAEIAAGPVAFGDWVLGLSGPYTIAY